VGARRVRGVRRVRSQGSRSFTEDREESAQFNSKWRLSPPTNAPAASSVVGMDWRGDNIMGGGAANSPTRFGICHQIFRLTARCPPLFVAPAMFYCEPPALFHMIDSIDLAGQEQRLHI